MAILALFAFPGCNIASKQGLIVETKEKAGDYRLNLNAAEASEIESLPEIGPQLAQRIVEHRERFGPFRNETDIILVRGMSDSRFRKIRHLIAVR